MCSTGLADTACPMASDGSGRSIFTANRDSSAMMPRLVAMLSVYSLHTVFGIVEDKDLAGSSPVVTTISGVRV